MGNASRQYSKDLELALTDDLKMELAKLPFDGQGEITLVNPKRSGRATIRGYGFNGQYRPFLDKFGKERVFGVTKKTLLNFADINDCLLFIQAKDHPIYTVSNTPILKVVDINEKASEAISMMDLQGEATGLISKMAGDDIFNFARVLGVPIRTGSNASIIKALIYDKAKDDPKTVLDELKSPDRYMKEVFFAAKAKGLVTDRSGTWYFKSEKIGVTLDQALNWFNENLNIIPQILREIQINVTNFGKFNPNSGPAEATEKVVFDEKEWKDTIELGDELMKGEIYNEALEAYEKAKSMKGAAALQKKINEAKNKLKEAVE